MNSSSSRPNKTARKLATLNFERSNQGGNAPRKPLEDHSAARKTASKAPQPAAGPSVASTVRNTDPAPRSLAPATSIIRQPPTLKPEAQALRDRCGLAPRAHPSAATSGGDRVQQVGRGGVAIIPDRLASVLPGLGTKLAVKDRRDEWSQYDDPPGGSGEGPARKRAKPSRG